MVQATHPVDPRALARDAVADPANVDAVTALAELMSALHRSRMMHQHGAPATALLIHLAKHGDMRVTDLATAMHVDQSTASRQLAHLCTEGLVERLPDPSDRRAHVMSVTEAGLERVRDAMAVRLRDFETVVQQWSPADRAAFAALVGRFASDFDAQLNQGDTP